ncbi:MAG: hypothetical protein GY805_16260 [Chloroflexi bacterium]|nr:hypothetical protein [Chloroflexota bacterium]
MRDTIRRLYIFWIIIFLAVMFLGSPLASFGCHTLIPAKVHGPCETSLWETAVQTNFVQSAQPILAILISHTFLFLLFSARWQPKEIYLPSPSPPPRLFI